MSNRKIINTNKAPEAIGPYSQAVKSGSLLFISGQIPLEPSSMEIVDGSITAQARQTFNNLSTIALAADCSLNDAVKITLYLTDLAHFPAVNEVMLEFFSAPFPARACVEVSALPRQAMIEVDAILACEESAKN